MSPQKKTKESGFSNVSAFLTQIKQIEADPVIVGAMVGTPDELTKGRTFFEIACDDVIDAFIAFSFHAPEENISYTAYRDIFFLRTGQKLPVSEAKAMLDTTLENYPATGTEPSLSEPPAFIDVVINNVDDDTLNNLVELWGAAVEDISRMAPSLFVQSQRPGLPAPSSPTTPKMDQKLSTLLALYGDNLTSRAKSGQIPPVLGRDRETKAVMAALVQKGKPYALVAGPDGIGKSAVAENVAQQIAEGKAPAELKDAQVIRLRLRELRVSSGTGQKHDPSTGEVSMVDMFGDRLHYILQKTAEYNAKGGPQIILDFDELGDMGGRLSNLYPAKDILGSAMDIHKSLRIIGEVSDIKEFSLRAESPEFLGRFQRIKLDSVPDSTVLDILRQQAATHRNIITDERTLERVLKLTTRHIAATAKPGSALDILDGAIAQAVIEQSPSVTEDHLVTVVATKADLPKNLVGSEVSDRIKTLGAELPRKVLGQPAIQKIVDSLKLTNSGLHDPNKPLGSFLEVGPTGVGKTETAIALAELLGVKLITIDMANFQDQHAKAKLIGAPPGYVGYNDEPEFEKVNKSPYCVLLLDEIEKAHPDVFNVLLSVLDKGRVQLMNGRTVDFRNAVIIMSSNLGARDAQAAREKRPLGFNDSHDPNKAAGAAYEDAIKSKLPPEFINRLNAILEFKRLEDKAVIKGIALKKVAEVSRFLTDRNQNLTLDLSETALEQLVDLGYNPDYGARPMDRAIQDYIKVPLSTWLLEKEDTWAKGDEPPLTAPATIHVKGIKDKFDIEIRDNLAGKPSARPPAPIPRVA